MNLGAVARVVAGDQHQNVQYLALGLVAGHMYDDWKANMLAMIDS